MAHQRRGYRSLVDYADDNSAKYGLFARLPYELRVQIYNSGPYTYKLASASRALQSEIYSERTLTFTVTSDINRPDPIARRTTLPTYISVSDGHYYDARLHPSLFVFDSPEPERPRRLLHLPYWLLRSVRIVVMPPGNNNMAESIRLFNSLTWLVELLNRVELGMPPLLQVQLSDSGGAAPRLWAQEYTALGQLRLNRSFPGAAELLGGTKTRGNTDAAHAIRALRQLPKASSLVVTFPDYFHNCMQWPEVYNATEQLHRLVTPLIYTSDSERARLHNEEQMIRAWLREEEQMMLAFYDLFVCHFPAEAELLNRERLAYWTTHYDNTVTQRLEGLSFGYAPKSMAPSWIETARRTHQEQRSLARMYNPLAPHWSHILSGLGPHTMADVRIEYMYGDAGGTEEGWRQRAWFSWRLPPNWHVPKVDSQHYRNGLARIEDVPLAKYRLIDSVVPWPKGGGLDS